VGQHLIVVWLADKKYNDMELKLQRICEHQGALGNGML